MINKRLHLTANLVHIEETFALNKYKCIFTEHYECLQKHSNLEVAIEIKLNW